VSVLVLLLIALLAVLVWIGWKSRRTPYLSGACCHTAPWPPDDLTSADRGPVGADPTRGAAGPEALRGVDHASSSR